MDIKMFLIKILQIVVSWQIVTLILGWRIVELFSPKITPATSLTPNLTITSWEAIIATSTAIASITASIAAYFAYKTWKLESLPIVHAVGTFIISTKKETNPNRDTSISKQDSLHTLQLVNVGKGSAKKVVPSVRGDIEGYFLEDINPHAFSLPSNQGTRLFGETVRVHGQRFVRGNKYELEFENSRETAYFYIHFEDYTGRLYLTKVRIERVNRVDDQELDKLIRANKGIEVWKVMDNIKETK